MVDWLWGVLVLQTVCVWVLKNHASPERLKQTVMSLISVKFLGEVKSIPSLHQKCEGITRREAGVCVKLVPVTWLNAATRRPLHRLV